MAKKFTVYVDMTFSGTMEIEADKISEAKAIARLKSLVPSDLRSLNACHIKTRVTDAFEEA